MDYIALGIKVNHDVLWVSSTRAQRWHGEFTAEKICASVKEAPEHVGHSAIDNEYLHQLHLSGIGSRFDACEMTWVRTLGYPLTAYLCWQLSYLFKTEVQDRELIRENKNIEVSDRIDIDRIFMVTMMCVLTCFL